MCSARSAGLGGRTAGGLLALQLPQRIEPEVELVRHRHRALLPLRPEEQPRALSRSEALALEAASRTSTVHVPGSRRAVAKVASPRSSIFCVRIGESGCAT